MLRCTARRTWRYFDDFVGPQTHWLPPDNFQEAPARELFLRTSPTNVGLWMLATVAANDFGYITLDEGYGNTGQQASGATPHAARTATTDAYAGYKKDLFAISAAHRPEHIDRAVAAFTKVGRALGVLAV